MKRKQWYVVDDEEREVSGPHPTYNKATIELARYRRRLRVKPKFVEREEDSEGLKQTDDEGKSVT